MRIFALLFTLLISNISFSQDTLKQIEGKMEKEINLDISVRYLIYFPPEYDQHDKWPLLLFLHGSGERGDDLTLVKRNGPPMLVDKGRNFPFILVSPQCPSDKFWDVLSLMTLLDEIEKNYKIDKSRIYVTGLSIGGTATWELAFAQPGRFAAIAPVCGRTGSLYLNACQMKNIPVWIFHGAKDEVIPLSESERMFKALKECGNDVQLSVYPEGNHDVWTETYNNEELYRWFLEHHLDEN